MTVEQRPRNLPLGSHLRRVNYASSKTPIESIVSKFPKVWALDPETFFQWRVKHFIGIGGEQSIFQVKIPEESLGNLISDHETIRRVQIWLVFFLVKVFRSLDARSKRLFFSGGHNILSRLKGETVNFQVKIPQESRGNLISDHETVTGVQIWLAPRVRSGVTRRG